MNFCCTCSVRTERAAGACPGCLKYLHRNHADLLNEPAKSTISIGDARDSCGGRQRNHMKAGIKRCHCPRARDAMTPQAQNAPPEGDRRAAGPHRIYAGSAEYQKYIAYHLSRCIILKMSFSREETENCCTKSKICPRCVHAFSPAPQRRLSFGGGVSREGFFEIRG